MKKSIAALALALTLVGTLASCSNRDPNADYNTGSAGNQNGIASGSTAGSASGTAGTVSRRYGGENAYYGGDYFEDGRYTAAPDGRVYDRNTKSRDLTQDARDIVRDTGDAIGDMGRDIGDMFTGNGSVRGNETPSWEPDSSAVRF